MTTQAVAATVQYGMRELRTLYQKYSTFGLLAAMALHLSAIGSYYLAGYLSEEDEPIGMVRIVKYSELGPPPSITNTETVPQVAVEVPVAKPTIGVPVPVPDAEVSPEQTIPTQQELSSVPTPTIGTEGTGGVQIQQDINIEEPPDDFVLVEKDPVPVKIVQAEYPEIARRAGVEGTVIVKCWVDKEGKVRKVVVLKSDAEIFNEPAIKAAYQWVFTPALMNNGPVSVWASFPFRFKLTK